MVYIPNTVPGNLPPDGVGGFGKPNGPDGTGGFNAPGGIGGIGGIGDELVIPTIAESIANTEVQTTFAKIGDITNPNFISNQPACGQELSCAAQEKHRTVASTGETPARHCPHQFTNSRAETIVNSDLQPIGDHQLPHQLNHTPPTYDPPGGDGGSPVTPTYNSPSGDGAELLNDSEMAAIDSRLNACQTLDDALEFHTALASLSQEQRDSFESTIPESKWVWLWNLPEALAPEPIIDTPVVEPSLSELKALLLACNTLTALNELKRTHQKTTDEAYDSMSDVEQAHVDALAALAVPYKVFKYLGEEIKLGTERLHRGMLVYIDPQTQGRATASSAPVWALNGVKAGWKRPICVSLSVLREVVKVVCESQNQDGGQQMDLI